METRISTLLLYLIFILAWIAFFYHWRKKSTTYNTYRITKYLTLIVTLSLWVAMIMLIYAFIVKDYSLLVVFGNVDNQMTLFDRIMATWAARPGAMLLWALVQSTITLYILHYLSDSHDIKFHKRMISIILFFNALVISFAISVRDPTAFEVHNITGITDGLGLTPSLRNFWQQIHPPIAFLSYSAFIVPYAVGLSGLMNKDGEEITDEGRWLMDFFMLVGWVFTTFFIIAGSLWAYEVDWGGLWFFDGVQTSSFILWIMASSYFHLKPLMNKDAPIHLFSAALGWLGVAFAALIVRGGFLEGPHTYTGSAQRIVFSLLLLGTLAGLIFALSKTKKEIVPEWLFEFKISKNRYSLWTVWLLALIIIINITSLVLQIVYVQLDNDLGDLTLYYRTINGTLLTLLVVLLVLCENDSIRPPKNIFKVSFIIGLMSTLIWSLFVFDEIRIYAYLLLLITGATVVTQLILTLFATFHKMSNRRIHLRLTHFIIILTLFSYFITDPHTVEVQTVVTNDDATKIDKLELIATLLSTDKGNISNNIASTVRVLIQDLNNNTLGIVVLKQGLYLGQPWSKGDWITSISKDIYVKLSFINSKLFVIETDRVSIIIKSVPGINLFRLNILIFSFIGVIAVIIKFRTKPTNQIKSD